MRSGSGPGVRESWRTRCLRPANTKTPLARPPAIPAPPPSSLAPSTASQAGHRSPSQSFSACLHFTRFAVSTRAGIVVPGRSGQAQKYLHDFSHREAELNVTATTIARDLEVLGITANKKPTATIRKPALVFKVRSPAITDRKVASQNPTRPHQPAPRNKNFSPRPVSPRIAVPLKPRPPKTQSPEIPLSPEQLRHSISKRCFSWCKPG
jgi:hypothetical protein